MANITNITISRYCCVYWRTYIIIYWYNTTGWTIINWLLVKPTPSIYIRISKIRLWNAAPTYISINNASFKPYILTNIIISRYCFVYWRTYIIKCIF